MGFIDTDYGGEVVVRDLEERVRKNPSSRLFAPLADTYRRDGNIDGAIALLIEGLSHNPDYPSARVLLARCLEDLGKWEEAQVEWRNVLKLDDTNLVALKAMGEICRLLGSLEESSGWFRMYLDEFPGDDSVRLKLDEIEKAVSILEESPEEMIDENQEAALPENDVVSHEGYGDQGGLIEDQERDDAGAIEEDLHEEEDPVETITLAEIYAQQGFYERAIDIYGRILVNSPDDTRISERLEALNEKLSKREELEASTEEKREMRSDDESSGVTGEKESVRGDSEKDADRVVLVDVNRAGPLELETIPGVGPVIAQKMIVERERNGPFAGTDDLERVPGMGVRLVERIGPHLVFESVPSEEDQTIADVVEAGDDVGYDGVDSSNERVEIDVNENTDWGDKKPESDSEFEEFRRWLKNLRK